MFKKSRKLSERARGSRERSKKSILGWLTIGNYLRKTSRFWGKSCAADAPSRRKSTGVWELMDDAGFSGNKKYAVIANRMRAANFVIRILKLTQLPILFVELDDLANWHHFPYLIR